MLTELAALATSGVNGLQMFFPPNTEAPKGYDYIDLGESDIAVCWIKGKEDGGIYEMHDEYISKYHENGIANFRSDDKDRAYFFERYQCPRFTQPDEQGNVILDYGIYLAD
jgi:hypothetical protein